MPATVHLALPKGRMEQGVVDLLASAGMRLHFGVRGYRPVSSEPGFEVKLLKPQNIVEMLAAGTRDLGFAGADWVVEQGAELVELINTGLDPVRIVAAAPAELLEEGRLPERRHRGRQRVRAALPKLDHGAPARRPLRPLLRSHRGVPTRRRRRDRRQQRHR